MTRPHGLDEPTRPGGVGPIELALVAALREVARRKAERRATLTVVEKRAA